MPTPRLSSQTIETQTLAHLRALSDFVGLLGLMWGIGLGVVLARYGSNDSALATQIIGDLLLQKLPSLMVGLVMAVRLVLFQSLERDAFAPIGVDLMASLWASWVALVIFLCMALLGLGIGIETNAPGMAWVWLDPIGSSYNLSELPRLLARTAILGLGLGWLGHLDRVLLTRSSTAPSRNATRLLWLMVIGILMVEVLDSYLNGLMQ